MSTTDLSLFQPAFSDYIDSCFKAQDPIKDVFANAARQQDHGTPQEAADSLKWRDNYGSKVAQILNENARSATTDLGQTCYAAPRQFFSVNDGKPQAETLYVVFPPTETKVLEGGVIAVPYHSTDPIREAELRTMPDSLKTHASVSEMYFAFRTSGVYKKEQPNKTVGRYS